MIECTYCGLEIDETFDVVSPNGETGYHINCEDSANASV